MLMLQLLTRTCFFLSLVIFSDHVFDPKTNNHEVFNTVARPIIDSSVSGFNGTIFAYGQTSSGNVMFYDECFECC